MKLTRFTDYALRVLIYAGLRGNDLVTIREVSDAYGISRNHLMKVVSNLTRLGYLDSRRGPGGGITLSRPASAISIADVINDMEEDMHLVTCFRKTGECTIEPVCRLKLALAEALSAYVQTLENYTLQDLLKPQADLKRVLRIS
ncbi:MAG TPA: Rrf2 family transcriptional regulator [Xanthomonadales bacterium]|nr:Rrf2 family transcriptional regulator [Xanthomonadales bacterium]